MKKQVKIIIVLAVLLVLALIGSGSLYKMNRKSEIEREFKEIDQKKMRLQEDMRDGIKKRSIENVEINNNYYREMDKLKEELKKLNQ